MGNIITKLNLNRTPSIVENNSMVFAKNIRIDIDGTIHKDYSINPMSIVKGSDIDTFYETIFNRIKHDVSNDFLSKLGNFDKIIDIIPDSNGFYVLLNGTTGSIIVYFDEKSNIFKECNCNWNYSGGKIDGCVVNNLLGEKILNIGEYDTNGYIPLKSINLNKSKITDDESIYTQAPNIPITNINYAGTFSYTIPNGVYQFFVRYKIREGFYTNWFLASRELFAGNKYSTITNYGTLSFTNTHLDCNHSFIFSIEHLFSEYYKNFESFQIGFIVSHDDAVYGRGWKHFDFNQTTINFDYRADDSEEIEVIDLLGSTFQLYNVGNIANFKNKLYISNYTETNFNEDLQSYADSVKIAQSIIKPSIGYNEYSVTTEKKYGKNYITALEVNNSSIPITGYTDSRNNIGIIQQMFKDEAGDETIEDIIKNAATDESSKSGLSDLYGFYLFVNKPYDIKNIQKNLLEQYRNKYYPNFQSLTFDDNNPVSTTINGIEKSLKDCVPYICNQICYLDENANFTNSLGEKSESFNIIITRKATLKYTIYSIDTPSQDSDNIISNGPSIIEPGTGTPVTKTEVITYEQKITVDIKAYKDKLVTNNTNNLIDYTTLIPYQKYKFYVHYVKSTGEITNGYECLKGNTLEVLYKENCDSLIYPIFTEITIPSGYIACFFSIIHHSINASTIYNIDKQKDTDIEGSCLELNTRLYPASYGMNIKQGDNITKGDYYYSSNSDKPRYFGANGVINITNSNFDHTKAMYVISEFEASNADDISLVKCTPYIKNSQFTSYQNLNLLGYLCQIHDTDRNRSIDYYSDGSNAFRKFIPTSIGAEVRVQFKDLYKYKTTNMALETAEKLYKVEDFNLITTSVVNIYSNFNFNYVALSEEPKESIKTYYDKNENVTADTAIPNDYYTCSVLWRLIPSLTMSDIYELPSMYRIYTRKTFLPHKDNEITRFDNTVRSSLLEGDEAHVSIFKFDPADYYNVPTNRGIIVNLLSVGDSILIHTKDSMFRFNGSNSLQASSGDIQTAETDVFQSGISEIFGSDFGFAGLQYKQDHIVTENGYIFFDRDSGIIYMYSGQGQITKLSDSVEKLFRFRTISNIRFANDYYNNRFFVCIWFNLDNETIIPVTLSFNLTENIKSFVSLHDFAFEKAFNTKVNCYFLTRDNNDICTIDKERVGEYYKLEINSNNKDRIYPSKFTKIIKSFKLNEEDNIVDKEIPKFYSILDIINNINFETVKTLDCLTWSSRNVIKEFPISEDNTINMADSQEGISPCHSILLYSDTCQTKELLLTDIANNYSITNPNSYMYPRFNQGYWSLNYFRNILNANDKFNYIKDNRYIDSRDNNIRQPEYRSDENSLVEGRYFVCRFIFDPDNDFKLENISFNSINKL